MKIYQFNKDVPNFEKKMRIRLKTSSTPLFYQRLNSANKVILGIASLLSLLLFICSISVFYSINDSISSLRLPNGYYYRDFNTSDPRIEFAFGIRNNGIFSIDELTLDIAIAVNFFNISDGTEYTHQIFRKRQHFPSILPFKIANATLIGTSVNFEQPYLEQLHNNIDELVSVKFYISILFQYRYFFKAIPVELSFHNLSLALLECPTCQL